MGIETDRGLWVSALVAAGYQVYAINPLAASRAIGIATTSAGAKSDAGDAKVLADLVRTDRHNHRQIAGDTPTRKRSGLGSWSSEPDLGPAPATPTCCATRCASTTRRR